MRKGVNRYCFSRKLYDGLAMLLGVGILAGLMAFGQEPEHPPTCALTAPAHSLMMSEYMTDPEIQKIYQAAAAKGFRVVARLGVVVSEEGKKEQTALYLFVRDGGINYRVYYQLTPAKHYLVVLAVPGQMVDNSLINLLKK